jgi:hypothetical protein
LFVGFIFTPRKTKEKKNSSESKSISWQISNPTFNGLNVFIFL